MLYEAAEKSAKQYQGAAIRGTAADVQKPRLQEQAEQMERVLHQCFNSADRIEGAANRLTGPRPQDASKALKEPSSNHSLEMRLATLISMAETLSDRLSGAANHLDSAA